MTDNAEDRSGLGCIWIIGWTVLSVYAYGFAAYGFESGEYPAFEATTWSFRPEEIVLLGIWLVFWLGGIAVWHTTRWLWRSRQDSSSEDAGTTGFALGWGIFLVLLTIGIVATVRPFNPPYESTHRWLWFLDPPASLVFITGVSSLLWTLGIVGWSAIRMWLWQRIDGSATP